MHSLQERRDVRLTPRQLHVVRLVAEGFSTQEIATRLSISARTAQWHVSRLMAIFDAPNRAALVLAAMPWIFDEIDMPPSP